MPAFNAGMFVSGAIDSIRSQTLQDWELIVVDDGSTDDTAQVVMNQVQQDPRIRLVRTTHAGIADALNRGIAQAQAPVIARMDSDDVSLPCRLERQVEYLNQHPEVGVVSCRVELLSRQEGSQGLQTYVEWVNSLETHREIWDGRFIDAPVIHPSVCFRSELVWRWGGYRQGDFPEDYELWLRWMQAGVQFAQVSEILLQWRDHAGKLTRTDARYREQVMWDLKGRFFGQWFLEHIAPNRELVIWGAGRKSRSRLPFLETVLRERTIAAFVDVDPKKIGQIINGVPVLPFTELSSFHHPFVMGMVGSRGARLLIRNQLISDGYQAGCDFLMFA